MKVQDGTSAKLGVAQQLLDIYAFAALQEVERVPVAILHVNPATLIRHIPMTMDVSGTEPQDLIHAVACNQLQVAVATQSTISS